MYFKLKTTEQDYQKLCKQLEPKPHLLRDTLLAFLSGGTVCLLGQGLIDLYGFLLSLPKDEAAALATVTLILISGLLTGLGVFDKISKWAGAGIGVPVTGFANSMVSSALEFKKEGYILGVGSKLFSLAGTVITYGVVTAFVMGLVKVLVGS